LDDERRNDIRRSNDIADIAEVRLLRHEIRSVQEGLERTKAKLEEEEAKDHRRLVTLEAEVAEFKRKFAVGKGFFYGSIFVLGSVGVYLVDHMKEMIINLRG